MDFCLITLGCPKNQADSDAVSTLLKDMGWRERETPEVADLILVNTCSFIVPAVKESVDVILEVADLGEEGRRIGVLGCLVSRYGKRTLQDLLPEVDFFLSPREYHLLPSFLRPALGELKESGEISLKRRYASTLRRGYVYLKIADGCHRRCAYCTIPAIRGRLRSRPWPDILEEARYFLHRGARELVLVAQDTTSYGRDLAGEADLPFLIRRIAELDGEYRIRIMYMHPQGMNEKILECMDNARVYPYFDLPMQHVDPSVLEAMGRKGDAASYRRLIMEIRERFPEAALRATFMVGFPGEDARSFRGLLDFVAEMRFDWLGLFGYSQEEGTPAFALGPGCSPRVRRERLQRLYQLQEEIMREKALRMVGRKLRVLLEGASEEAPGYWEARSYREAPEIDGVIFVPESGTLRAGEWLEVVVESAEGIDLIAVSQNFPMVEKNKLGGG